YRLKAPFARMGMSEAFSRSTADLSGMGGRKGDLWIDDVIHKAVVEVDEVGTKAAAVTGAVIRATAFRPDDEPVVFHCDQPFLVAITSGRTVLFLGRVADPGN
ncbi:MAG: serpin family protein, partial [Opitutia bacterium]